MLDAQTHFNYSKSKKSSLPEKADIAETRLIMKHVAINVFSTTYSNLFSKETNKAPLQRKLKAKDSSNEEFISVWKK